MQVSLIPQIQAYPVLETDNGSDCYSKNRSKFFSRLHRPRDLQYQS